MVPVNGWTPCDDDDDHDGMCLQNTRRVTYVKAYSTTYTSDRDVHSSVSCVQLSATRVDVKFISGERGRVCVRTGKRESVP